MLGNRDEDEDARLTKSRRARSKQLLMMYTELLTKYDGRRALKWIELFKGPATQFSDMKYLLTYIGHRGSLLRLTISTYFIV